MAGIDNITNEILQEAKERAASVTGAATKKADNLLAQAKQQGEEFAAKTAEKAKADAAAYGERILSQMGLRKRQALLRAKQEIITGVIDAAYEKLHSLGDKEYFAMIMKLAVSNLQSGDGEILFSKKDLERLPKDFAEQIREKAKLAGGTLAVSAETAEIDDGFILRYGGIDENCTLKALFAEKRDVLSDKVAAVLWHKENADG